MSRAGGAFGHGYSAAGRDLDPADIFADAGMAMLPGLGGATAAQHSGRGALGHGGSPARGRSAVAAAAALGIGPGLAYAATSGSNGGGLSSRVSLPSMNVPQRRKPSGPRPYSGGRGEDDHAAEEKEQYGGPGRRPSSRSRADEDDAPQAKIAVLRLPMLRNVFLPEAGKTASGSAAATDLAAAAAAAAATAANGGIDADVSGTGGFPTIVGGPDADFENYERSLGLQTGEDAIEFFARKGGDTPVKFVYANRKDTGDVYRPYDLVVVSRKEVAAEYFTISTTGVVHVHAPQPSEFVSLAEWVHESAMYNVLRCIRFFKNYLHAKMFRLWRANVRYRIFSKQRRALSRKLFLARESFASPLLEVKRIMFDFDSVPISNVRPGVYQAENFVKDQVDARTVASKKFEERFERLADAVEKVCKGVKDRARQYDHRIANDDLINSRFAQHLLGGNGRIRSMVSIKNERADRLRQLKHANLEADMLGDFIRLVDYIEVEHLVLRSTSTTVQFLHLLLNSNKALFQTTVSFAKEAPVHHPPGHGHGHHAPGHGLLFAPTAREIHAIMSSMSEHCISTVDTVDRILHHPKFKPFVSPLLTDSPKIGRLIHADRTYNLSRAAIADKIDIDFQTVEMTISFLERHRPVHDFGERWNLDEYCNGREHTVDSIARDMLQQSEWNLNIRSCRDLYGAGIFEVNTKDLKSRLTPVTETALAGMKELLLRIFHAKCLELQELYQSKIKQLDEEPTSLPLFAAHVELFTTLRAEGSELLERSRTVEAMHRLMLEHDMQAMIPPQDEVAFDDLLGSVAAFDAQINTTEARIEEKMQAMKQTVYKNIARLNNELEQQKLLLDEGIFVDEKAYPRDVLRELDRVRAALGDIRKQTVTLQGYQVLFEKSEPYPFLALPATVAVYERKRGFWELYAGWLEKVKKWNHDDFLSLDVAEVDRDVSASYASAAKMHEESRDGPAAAVTLRVKHMVQEFKALMPMLLELGHKAVKAPHWRQIFTALGAGYYPQNEKIRLKNLRKMNIFAHRQLISEICAGAVGEAALHASLAGIQAVWSGLEFSLQNPFPHNKEVFVLGDVAEVQARLGEHRATLQSMQSSGYIASVAQEVALWEKKLAFLSEVLAEWMACQANWMALTPVFSAHDMQRQMPLESKIFADVDRFWKETMRRTTQNPNVMHSTTQPQILAQLIKANKEMERIQKHLAPKEEEPQQEQHDEEEEQQQHDGTEEDGQHDESHLDESHNDDGAQ